MFFGYFSVADTGFEKGGGTLTNKFQINGFWPEFYIKKVKFAEKREGLAPPHHTSKSATVFHMVIYILL